MSVAALAGSVWTPAAAAATEGTTTTVSLSATSTHPYEPVTATATVVGNGEAIPSGTVNFSRGKQTLCTAVPLDASTSTAGCDLPAGQLAMGASAVTAAYVPTAGTIFGPSSGSARLAVSKWTPALTATAVRGTGDCANQHLLHFTVSAPADASDAVAAGLPAPSGSISAPTTGYSDVPLSKNGTAHFCAPLTTSTTGYTYSGDAYFNTAQGAISVKQPDTAPHGGAPAPKPRHHHRHHRRHHPNPGTAPHGGATAGSSSGGLADTGPSASVAPALELGTALVLLGLVLLVAGRRQRWSRRA